MLAAVRSVVPRPVRRRGRHLLDRFAHLWDRAVGRAGIRPPPADLVDGIGGGWEVGGVFLGHFRDVCRLGPDEAVLDVGCGVGRMAAPLTAYLSPRGRYDGFDIMAGNVRWCRRAITPRFPNFRFVHADVYNREYNPGGRESAAAFRFPYPDAAFDFVFATSVFTHLLPADAAHYLAELGRVLRPGGRGLVTVFLLNAEAERLVGGGGAPFPLLPADGPARVSRADVPEECVALDEGFVLGAVGAAGLTADPPRYGHWCGRSPAFEYQDVVVVRKPA